MYFKLTFANNESFAVESELEGVELVKRIRRYVGTFYFDTTIMLDKPIKVEQLTEKPNKIFKNWDGEYS